MPRLNRYELSVIRTENLTKHMKRITLGGDELASFPENQESAYIKLILPNPDVVNPSEDDYAMRTYTVRSFDLAKREMDVDFVLHGDHGLASKWAMNAAAGDSLTIAGPGAKKLVNFDANWFFLVGDMTALPAISVNVESLPKDAKGYMVLEIASEEDKQSLNFPEGIEVHWVINPHPNQENTLLIDKVKTLDFLDGQPSIWAACEFSTMRALRQYFKQDMQVDRMDIYVSSYWKMGLSEDEHKSVKSKDAKAQR